MLDKIESKHTNSISIEDISNNTMTIIKKKKKKPKKKREICRPILFISDSSSSDTE